MKRTYLAVIAVTLITNGLVMAATTTLTPSQLSVIGNTKHNFANQGYAWADGQICRPCHTPHHAITDDNISNRLWNHQLSTSDYTLDDGTTATYTAGLDSTLNFNQGMDRVSRLCLGCHDGTVALDAFGLDPTDATGATRYNGTAGATGNAGFAAGSDGAAAVMCNLGTDFRDDHPVGVTAKYPGTGSAAASSYMNTATSSVRNGVTSYKVGAMSLAKVGTDYVVGCKTCHNPHGAGTKGTQSTTDVQGTAGVAYTKLLAVPPNDLCVTCHIK